MCKYKPHSNVKVRSSRSSKIKVKIKVRSSKVTKWNVAWLPCDTHYTGHLGRIIRCWHSSLGLTRGEVNIGQIKVKLGQIRQNFQNKKKSSKNMPILSSFTSGFQKIYLFLSTVIRNAKKNCISCKWGHHLYPFLFLTIAQSKIKILLWNNLVCVLFLCSFTTWCSFFITSKFWIL